MSKQVSHQDFLDIDRELEAEQASPPSARPQDEQQEDRPALYGVNWHEYVARRYAETTPPQIKWLLTGTMPVGIVSVIAAPGGSGKSTAMIQGAIEIATGLPFLGIWPPSRPLKTLFLSVEDCETILHQRIHHRIKQLPKEHQELAKENVVAIPLRGDVELLTQTAKGKIEQTANFKLFEDMIRSMQPDIVFCDTYSRFVNIEDCNTAATKAVGKLEMLCDTCSIAFIHHTTKAVKSIIKNDEDLDAALDPRNIRGASSIVNSARLAIMLAPLGRDYASKKIDPDAGFYRDTTYLAIRASKKNYGKAEDPFFLQRGGMGLFSRVDPLPVTVTDGTDESNVLELVEKIKELQEKGDKPLAVSSVGATLFGWGTPKSKRIIQLAVNKNLLQRVPRPNGNGEILICK